MSGGSFDYLCWKEPGELSDYEFQIERMRDALIDVGYAPDAARETDELLLIIRQMKALIDLRIERLRPVWHAMEWWRSSDSIEKTFKEALEKYRGGLKV